MNGIVGDSFPDSLWIAGGLVVSPDADSARVRRGSLLLERGRIGGLYEAESQPPHDVTILDASGMIVIPGLVNAHVHSHGVLSKWLVDGMPLEIWSPYVAAGRTALTPAAARLSALLVGIEALRGGVTTVLDHPVYDEACLNAAAEAYLEVGIRTALAPSVMDLPYSETIPAPEVPVPIGLRGSLWIIPQPPREDLVALTRRCIKRWHGAQDRMTVLVGPSAPQRCSDDLLRALASVAAEARVATHTHLLETKGQALLAAERYGGSILKHLERIGFLESPLSVAHAVWVTEEDVRALREHDVTVVHNPISNMTLGSGLMPLVALRDGGVTLALGTDSPNSGGHHVIFESMRLAAALPRAVESDVQRWPTADEAFCWATTGGAQAVGLGPEIGKLEPGCRADLVLLRRESTALTPLNHVVRQLVFSERGESVDTVIVGGRIVVRSGKVQTVDEGMVLREAQRVAEELRESTQHAFESAKAVEGYTKLVYEKIRRSAGPAPLWHGEGGRRLS